MKPNPDRRTGWRARYVDSDTERTKWVTLPPDLTTRDQREDWAVRLSNRITKRRRELEDGAVRASGVTLEEAEAAFYRSLVKKRPRTLETYRDGTARFMKWAKQHRVRTCDDLTRRKLMAFRESLLAEAGSPFTFNKWLRPCKQMWGYWIDSEYCPKISLDDLKRVKLEKATAERRDFLIPAQLRKLLEAAERHDRDAPKPVTGFVLFLVLTGMRRGEAVSLEWGQVDFTTADHLGREVGNIHIPAAKAKTGKPRDVRLSVSPTLRQLLMTRKLHTGGRGKVWGLTVDEVRNAMERMRDNYGTPYFTFQALRRTTSTYLCNAPGVPCGGPYGAAEQLGHGLDVMRDHYAGRVSVSADVTTLDGAMGVEALATRIAGSTSFDAKKSKAP